MELCPTGRDHTEQRRLGRKVHMSGGGKTYLALDLGAESGRAIAGTFDGERLSLREVHRFPNAPVRRGESFHWDLPALFNEVKRGIAAASALFDDNLVSVGVDTWGVDYGLLDEDGTLMGLPHQYRDSRTAGIQDSVIQRLGKDFLYEQTGIQLMEMNTLYQLLAEPPERLSEASRLLFIPDLINYWLTGVKSTERTFASTSQVYDVRKRDWAYPLLDEVGLPSQILGDIRDAGESLGPLLPQVADETGASGVNVVLPGTHDTASAVAAVPAGEGSWAFLSSGTWSLLGVETPGPVMNDSAKTFELGNEVGVLGTVRPLKNISGLWLVQQCRATWEAQGNPYSYAELTRMAEASTPFTAIIDPDDPSFTPPGDMPARIADFCDAAAKRRHPLTVSSCGQSWRASRYATGWCSKRSRVLSIAAWIPCTSLVEAGRTCCSISSRPTRWGVRSSWGRSRRRRRATF